MSNTALSVKDIKSSPIIEAIVEVKFNQLDQYPDPSVFKSIINELKLDIDKETIKKRFSTSMQVKLDENNDHTTKSDIREIGIEMKLKDNTSKIIILENTRILISNIGTYCGSDDLIDTLLLIGKSYRKHLKLGEICRIGIRNINKIICSSSTVVEKFTIIPSPPDIDQNILVNQMMYSFEFADESMEKKANVKYLFKSLDKTDDKPEDLDVYIDIDTYIDHSTNFEEDFIRTHFTNLRKFKNEIFEKSFTIKGFKEMCNENG